MHVGVVELAISTRVSTGLQCVCHLLTAFIDDRVVRVQLGLAHVLRLLFSFLLFLLLRNYPGPALEHALLRRAQSHGRVERGLATRLLVQAALDAVLRRVDFLVWLLRALTLHLVFVPHLLRRLVCFHAWAGLSWLVGNLVEVEILAGCVGVGCGRGPLTLNTLTFAFLGGNRLSFDSRLLISAERAVSCGLSLYCCCWLSILLLNLNCVICVFYRSIVCRVLVWTTGFLIFS